MVRGRRSDADGTGQVQGRKEGLTHECEQQGIRKGDGEKRSNNSARGGGGGEESCHVRLAQLQQQMKRGVKVALGQLAIGAKIMS